MAKHCETFDHTADVGLAARADSPAELFEALAEGLAEFLCPRNTVHPTGSRAIERQAEDIDAVVECVTAAGLSRKVARLRPVGEIKG